MASPSPRPRRARAWSWAARTAPSSTAACSPYGVSSTPRPRRGEQRLAELLLEAAHVPADRGLGEVQRLGGAVVAAVTDDREERAQVGEVEIHVVHRCAPGPDRKGPMTDAHQSHPGAIGPAGRRRARSWNARSPAPPDLRPPVELRLRRRRGGHPGRRPAAAARRAIRAREPRRGPARAAPRALAGRAARAPGRGRLLLQVVQFGGVYGGFALGVPAALSALVMLGLVAARHDRSGRRIGKERGDTRLWAGLASRPPRGRDQPRARARQRARRRRHRA